MFCGNPSRVQFKPATPTCSTTSRCCTKSGTFVQYPGDKCCTPTDWIDYTPEIITFSDPQPVLPTGAIVKGRYKIIDGNTMIVKFHYQQNDNTGGIAGSGTYAISLPHGLLGFVDADIDDFIVGPAKATIDGVPFHGYITLPANTHMSIAVGNENTTLTRWSSTNSPFDSADAFEFQAIATIELTDKILISS